MLPSVRGAMDNGEEEGRIIFRERISELIMFHCDDGDTHMENPTRNSEEE